MSHASVNHVRRVARRAPDDLDDFALDRLLASEIAQGVLRELHARTEIPTAARPVLAPTEHLLDGWRSEPPQRALAAERIRALCRQDGALWPDLCLSAVRASGIDPVAAARPGDIRGERGVGGAEGGRWLDLMFEPGSGGLPESPASAPRVSGRDRTVAKRVLLVAACGLFLLSLVRRRARS
ncbi:MAG: hypothetical protein HYX33_04170 [Actinobacteria bacterium]|nr:hypothetical protein [Actinomycetota bacterium]